MSYFKGQVTVMFKIYRKTLLCCNYRSILEQKCAFSQEVIGKKTCLYDFHVEQKGKMVDFAGFQMPVQYANHSVSESHKHTRNHVSIFDVSHMLQSSVSGKDRIQFIESLVVSDIQGLKDNQATLTVFTNEKGGIIDDLIVTKTDLGYLYLVSNAGCIEKDLKHLQLRLQEFKRKGADVEMKILNENALLAFQGPGMMRVLQSFVECDLSNLTFMMSTLTSLCGVKDCRITRCGYTGEDGVEVSVPASKARLIVENLLGSIADDVKLAGLAARDSLRLEAGLCLYGNDITEETTPVEAGLSWTIGKRRRGERDFPGAEVILDQLKNKPAKRRVGFVSVGLSPRAHTPVWDQNEDIVGQVSSGSPSPCLGKNIAMGYIPTKLAQIGTKVKFEIRKKFIEAEIVKMPFVPAKYYNK